LPKAWPKGSVKGLRARGGVEVDITWSEARVAGAVLRPALTREHRIRVPAGQRVATVSASGRTVPATSEDGTVRVKLEVGKVYQLRFV
jgi:alpha-L-fucosidase 2